MLIVIKTLMFSLPHAVNSEYTRRYFDEESKEKVENIVTNIKHEFQKIIRNLDWMDEETKKVALVKLNKMKSVVGYPKELMNDSLIIEEYKDYHVSLCLRITSFSFQCDFF